MREDVNPEVYTSGGLDVVNLNLYFYKGGRAGTLAF